MTDELWPDIPGYRLLGMVGKGGMGRVFRAEQEATGRTVALKVLSPSAVSATALANFAREAEIIARLEHPHILPVFDFGQWQALPFLAMRYVEQGSVADLLRQGPVDVERATRWARQVAEALAWAHGQGIVHKDVKPGNMLLGPGDNVYLTDFGIATGLTGETIRDGSWGAGSAAYMAPEQARGEKVDGRADLYALSVSLFEMVTGQKPYPAATATAALVRHQQDPIPWAQNVNPAIASALAELIAWGMAKSPEDRPASAADFVGYLERALAEPEGRLRPEGFATVESVATAGEARPARRRLTWLAVLGLALALAALLWWRGTQLAPVTTPAVAPASSAPALLPVATATQLAEPARQILFDDFDDPGGSFEVFSEESGRVAYEDGWLRFTTLQPDILLASPSEQVDAADVVVEVEAAFVSGPADSRIGIICRWQDGENYTALAFGANGTALIWQQRGETQHVLEAVTAPEVATEPSERRHLQAVCDGTRLQLMVDGLPVVTAAGEQPVAGDVVLMTHMPGEGELIVEFDDLVVWQPNFEEIGD